MSESEDTPRRVRSVTRRQFDEVMRRASELAAREAEAGEGDLAEAEVYRIAGEVGLSERHVRAALSDVRTFEGSRGIREWMLGPGRIHASRVVPGKPDGLSSQLDEFMVAGRLLERVRRSSTYLQYRPAVDWISQLARAASATSRKYFVASARSVEIQFDVVDQSRTLVEVVVGPGMRGDYLAGVLLGGGAAALAAGVGLGAALAIVMPLLPAVAGGAVLAVAVFWVGLRWGRGRYRRKLHDVQAEVEGLLDQLEAGRSLEPPPPSWRKWVERQFHGARRLFEPLGSGEDDTEGR